MGKEKITGSEGDNALFAALMEKNGYAAQVSRTQHSIQGAVMPYTRVTPPSNAYTNQNRPIGPDFQGGFLRAQNMSQGPLNNAYLNPNRPRG